MNVRVDEYVHVVELAKFSRESMEKIFTAHLNALEMLKNMIDVEQQERRKTLAKVKDPKYVPNDDDEEAIFIEEDIETLNEAIRNVKKATQYYDKLQYLYEKNEIYGTYVCTSGEDDNSDVSKEDDLYE